MSRTIRASELKPGQKVSSVTTLACNRRDIDTWQLCQPRAVISADLRQKGEHGRPVIYLTLDGYPRPAFLLAPDDEVTVEGAS